ncbi:MAG: phytoene/squalene synthase family protein [Deltaproteobacteria bacterium]|nr:phytoene/squalene synthase family protein [Deltaproteobacteria bacterium]
MNRLIFNTFKRGSKTYFYSSIFFSKEVRDDVFALYSFVRKADNFVDVMPQMKDEFYRFKDAYYNALQGKASSDIIINSFIKLLRRKSFNRAWIDAFFESMEMDLTKGRYETIEETLHYIYGSAEVIGLMMAKIMNLDPQSYQCAQYLGRAMQYINFIRDIEEDLTLGRTYLPLQDSGLERLDLDYVIERQDAFREFIWTHIGLYYQWQKEAEQGFAYIPKRYLIPIKTASDMYQWTAERIYRNPLVVFHQKVKPSIPRIVMQIAANSLMGTTRLSSSPEAPHG